MIPVFTVKFDRDSSSATDGFFVVTLTDTFTAAGIALANVTAYFNFTYPNGTRTGSFATPDITGNVSLVFSTLSLPLDSLGEVMSGTYTVTCFLRIAGAVDPGDTNSATFTIDTTTPYNDIPTTVSISAVSDCFEGILTVTNATSYGVWTAAPRELSVYPPPSLSLPTYTVAAASLAYAFGYSNANYELTVDDLLTYTTSIFTLTYRVEGTDNKFINCDINLCNLYACINQYLNYVRTTTASYGGIKNISNQVIAGNVTNLFMYYIQFQNAVKCSQYDTATTYYNAIAAIVSASGCNCGCSEGTSPTVFTPISQVNNTVIVQGTSPIQVTSVTVGSTTTYTVTTTAAFNTTFTQYGTDITTLQAEMNTAQADITTLQSTVTALGLTVLDQVVADDYEDLIPNTSTYTTVVTFTNLAGAENGTEWIGDVNFTQTVLPATMGFQLRINTVPVAVWEKVAVDNFGNILSAQFRVKKQSNTKVQLSTIFYYAFDSTGLLNSVVEITDAFQSVSEAAVADLSLNTLVIDFQAKSSNATLEMTSSNIKKFTKV